MKVCFVTPKTTERRSEIQYIQLGIAYLGSILLKNNHEVKVIDGRINSYSDQEILRTAGDWRPELIAVSSTSSQINESLRILKIIKEEYPEIKNVLGGAHFSGVPAEMMEQNRFIDFGVVGEGEYTILEIANGKDVSDIDGLVYRKEGNITLNKKREYERDLDKFPFPARQLFDMKKYYGNALEVKEKPMATIITSRGCPYGCVFCCKASFGPFFRSRSPKNVLDEMQQLVNEGYREIHIVDDNFSMDMKRAEEIFDGVINNGWNLKFAFPNGLRADRLDRGLLTKMKKAGVYFMSIGVESGDPKVLKAINKGVTLERIQETVKIARELGIFVNLFLVAGLPESTRESERMTLDFALKIDPDQASLGVVTPYPGSKLYDELFAKGLIDHDWGKYRHDFAGKRLLYKSEMTEEEVVEAWNTFTKKFYLRPSYPLKMIIRHKAFGTKKLYVMLRSLITRKLGG
ncbi:radical SAM protein [Candidatus Woesearchaeota archaeon]|nr:radical SAM protein [Candidatus Woesearchaeota archaeon]